MDPSLAVILLVIALVLLVGEVFIPSGGMILITACVCLAASIFFAWRAWWADDAVAWWIYVASLIVVVPSVIAGMLYWFPKTTMGKRVLLEAPMLSELTAFDDEVARLEKLIGQKGQTVTLLNPGGLVLVEGERHHCEGDGMMIDPQETVEVIGVSGNRLVVRPATPDVEDVKTPAIDEPKSAIPQDSPFEEDQPDDRPLDFEYPPA